MRLLLLSVLMFTLAGCGFWAETLKPALLGVGQSICSGQEWMAAKAAGFEVTARCNLVEPPEENP